MSQSQQWFTGGDAHPPLWIRLLFVPVLAFLIYGVAAQRGVALGILAVIVYGWIGVASIARPQALTRWSHAHPRADGAILGPIAFLVLAGLSPLAVTWCLLGGAVALVAGVAAGARRGRQAAVAEALVAPATHGAP
ncbi:hypothetical protein [Pengzhenrongella sp.]|uniref:hypothetical protein n=1 Tax=Pengzhenrongella sp. TaxID=2888820 RepID=UPI002F943004